MENPFNQISQQLNTILQQNDELYHAVSNLAANSILTTGTDNDIIGMDEACKFLGRAKATVYGMRSRREIPCLANGRFSRSELMKWLETKRRKTRSEITADAITVLTPKKKEGDK